MIKDIIVDEESYEEMVNLVTIMKNRLDSELEKRMALLEKYESLLDKYEKLIEDKT